MPQLTPQQVLEKLREKLGHLTLKPRAPEYMDTGFPDLNVVFGHRERGLQFGKIIELSGWESTGKSLIALALATLAQTLGALVIWVDVENSFDEAFAKGIGLDLEKIVLIQPQILLSAKKEERLSSAQELCREAEGMVKAMAKQYDKMFLCVDSVALLATEEEQEAGLDPNLADTMSGPKFFGRLMKRWMAMAATRNVLIFLLNQLRENPMAKFEDPEYTTGGNAIRFACHARAKVGRAKGAIKRGGKTIGMQAVITNTKNKSGIEREKVAFKYRWGQAVEFLPAKELEKDQE